MYFITDINATEVRFDNFIDIFMARLESQLFLEVRTFATI
jgi:hypothetical protein